jgi:hypothetical protein
MFSIFQYTLFDTDMPLEDRGNAEWGMIVWWYCRVVGSSWWYMWSGWFMAKNDWCMCCLQWLDFTWVCQEYFHLLKLGSRMMMLAEHKLRRIGRLLIRFQMMGTQVNLLPKGSMCAQWVLKCVTGPCLTCIFISPREERRHRMIYRLGNTYAIMIM